MPSKISLFLIGSLAVNAALLGVVGGRLVSQPKEPSVQMQLERYGPTSDVVAAAWAQLPDADRAELRKQLRERWVSLEGERNKLREAGQEVYNAAKAEPFNEGKLRDAVTIFQQREQRMQQSAEDILIGHLSNMPSGARATAAVGLLTPFNARMQRSDRPQKREGGEPAAPNGKPGDGKQGGLQPAPASAGNAPVRQAPN
ncbi:MAG TPA: periplasmic heavy metal sensor [Hyphomonadaceae bacterium]|nr:periplasmic heavy metal sensor [Hyphomonadaceae bacterium]